MFSSRTSRPLSSVETFDLGKGIKTREKWAREQTDIELKLLTWEKGLRRAGDGEGVRKSFAALKLLTWEKGLRLT